MTDTLEQELRFALAERASTMPLGAYDRLAELDYQPRVRQLPWPARPWSLAGASGITLAAVVVTAVLLLSSGGSSLVPLAYAGWSATPAAPTPAQIAKTTAECRRVGGPLVRDVLIGLGGRLMLAETRGRYVAVLYAKGRDAVICLSDAGRFGGVGAAGDDTGTHAAAPGPDQLGDTTGFGGSAPDFPGSAGSYEDAIGRAGRDVQRVVFILAGGRTVEATVKNGWYFAWWPNRNWPTRVEVTTRAGTMTSSMSVAQCREHPRTCVFAGYARA